MKNLLSILALFLILSACDTDNPHIVKYDEDGNIKEEYDIHPLDSVKHGPFIRYFQSGEKFEDAYYRNGVLDGKRTIYFQSGAVEIIEQYDMGTFAGQFRTFYENGQLELTGHYIKGVMTGVWKRYYNTGQLMEEVVFKNNDENGPFKEFYKNGNLKAEGTYKNGDNEHGLLILYDESGEIERKMDCNMGVCHTTWSRESTNETNE